MAGKKTLGKKKEKAGSSLRFDPTALDATYKSNNSVVFQIARVENPKPELQLTPYNREEGQYLFYWYWFFLFVFMDWI